MVLWFVTLMATRPAAHRRRPGRVLSLSIPPTGSCFLVNHPGIASPCSAACAWPSPGAEALYADLGHFGRGPIRAAWLGFVFPALASTISARARCSSPIQRQSSTRSSDLCPSWGVIPFVHACDARHHHREPGRDHRRLLADAPSDPARARCPRLEIRFTSESHQGQIFLPRVNDLLLFGVLPLVLALRFVERPRPRLRHLRLRRHGGRCRARHPRDLEGLALGSRLTLATMLPFLVHRPHLLGAEPA